MGRSTASRIPLEVKIAMTRRDVSQAALAEHLGLSAAAISRRLAGEVDFSIGEITAAAALLQVEPAELVPTSDALAEERAS